MKMQNENSEAKETAGFPFLIKYENCLRSIFFDQNLIQKRIKSWFTRFKAKIATSNFEQKFKMRRQSDRFTKWESDYTADQIAFYTQKCTKAAQVATSACAARPNVLKYKRLAASRISPTRETLIDKCQLTIYNLTKPTCSAEGATDDRSP